MFAGVTGAVLGSSPVVLQGVFRQTRYADPLLLAAFVSGVLAVYSLLYLVETSVERTVLAFALLMLGTSVWSFGYALRFASADLGAKLLWTRVQFVGAAIAPAAWLAFALEYANRDRWLAVRNLFLLLAVPATTLLLVFTNQSHGLMWTDATLPGSGATALLDRSLGLWFFVHAGYSYAVVALGILVLGREVVDAETVYRAQGLALLVGVLAPVVANLSFLAGLVETVDPTSMAFTLSGIAFATAIFRYRFLDLVPVARDSVIDDMRDGFLVLDDRDRVVDLNPSARALADADGEPIVGEPIATVFPEIVAGLDIDAAEVHQEQVTLAVDGTERHVAVQLSPLSAAGFFGRLVTLRDVTERRRVERRYQALIENSSDMIVLLDYDGTTRYASPSIESQIGHDPAELVGTNIVDLVHPEDRSEVIAVFESVVTEPGERNRVEHRLRNADGDYRDVETVWNNLLENDDVEGVVVNSRDITARKERERALERTNERLDQFASVVSHDLRNPLNVAKSRLDLAMRDPDREHLQEIDWALGRMEQIIQDVLALARKGQSVGDLETVDLEATVRDAWDAVEAPDSTLTVDDTVTIEADRARLRQLLENLLRNGVEHGGSDVTIRTGRVDDGFYVADDGPGIPESEREQAFEYGYSSREDGTGFGLAIVQRIASAHDWTVTATESREDGARFEFTGVERVDTAPDTRSNLDAESE